MVKNILLVILGIAIVVLIAYFFLSPRSTTVVLDSDQENTQTGDADKKQTSSGGDTLSSPESLGTEHVTQYFIEQLNRRFINEVGQPIEGFEPQMYMQIFPGILPGDFSGVEASQGIYSLEQGELIFKITETPEHSAARAITPAGMHTLLENISRRLQKPVDTTSDVDWLVGFLQTREGEFGV